MGIDKISFPARFLSTQLNISNLTHSNNNKWHWVSLSFIWSMIDHPIHRLEVKRGPKRCCQTEKDIWVDVIKSHVSFYFCHNMSEYLGEPWHCIYHIVLLSVVKHCSRSTQHSLIPVAQTYFITTTGREISYLNAHKV